jgi:SAM-dependent methyltransferase
MFTLALLDFLQTPAAAAALAELAEQTDLEAGTLRLITGLRRTFAPEEAAALLETARLRRKADAKFGALAQQMFFTADALEQSSHPLVTRFCRQVSQPAVLDYCCGIGTDSIAFALQGMDVTGVDADPVRVAMARLNSAAAGADARFVVGDVREPVATPAAIFFDPGRRENGRRVFHVEQYSPPLSALKQWQSPEILVKLAPGVDLAELRDYRGDITFVSVDGELKEALLRLSAGGRGAAGAVVIQGQIAYRYHPDDLRPVVPVADPQAFLVEPDAAIMRAGLVQDVAARMGGCLLDETIAYFTTPSLPVDPAVRAWRVVDWMPFQLKKLRQYLRERRIGHVTVKKRGSAITPESLLPQLKLAGDNSCVLALTRLRGAQVVIICDSP